MRCFLFQALLNGKFTSCEASLLVPVSCTWTTNHDSDRAEGVTAHAVAISMDIIIAAVLFLSYVLAYAQNSTTADWCHALGDSSWRLMHGCRAAATAGASGGESNEKLQLQLRQAQQMAAAVARKKDDMMTKLKRLTDKLVILSLLCFDHTYIPSALSCLIVTFKVSLTGGTQLICHHL